MTVTDEVVITPERVIFPVTAGDIANGKPKLACKCALALAIERALPAADIVIVQYAPEPDCAIAKVRIGGKWSVLILGRRARDCMRAVDAEQPYAPFEVDAEVRHG